METLLSIVNFIKNIFGISKPIPNMPKPVRPVAFEPIDPIKIEEHRVTNYTKCGYVRSIKYIIIHSTGGSIESTLSWFKNSEAKVSAHYTIDKHGYLYEMVDDNNIAWHAGKSAWKTDIGLNATSIGIELENLNDGKDKYSSAEIGVALWLCVRLMKKYNIPVENVLRHKDVAPGRKADPVNFPWESFIESLKRAVQS